MAASKTDFYLKVSSPDRGMRKENIVNLSNFITLLRLLITPVIIYTVIADFPIAIVAILFIAGMVTDFIDGQTARRFRQVTEFGRKFDMIADRILLLGTVAAFFIDFYAERGLDISHLIQIFLVLIREIISFPFAIYAFIKKKGIPHAKTIGKAATVMQGISFPLVMLSISYPFFSFSIYFAIATAVVGILSAQAYIEDIIRPSS